MSEHALLRAANDRRAFELGRIGQAASLLVMLLASVVLVFVYAFVAEGSNISLALSGVRGVHVLVNVGATLVVSLLCMRLTGRLDRKVAGVLNRVFLIHGGLAFFLLVSREFYSNKVMFAAAISSAALGGLVMLLRHVSARPVAALLGDWHTLASNVRVPLDWIKSPVNDLHRYDILLTNNVVDLSPEWSGPLTRAALTGRPIRQLAEFVEEDQGIVSVEHFDLEHLPTAGLTSYRTRKRLMDIALVLLSLPISVPVLLCGMLVVFVTMGRPIMFMQSRMGLGGKPFTIYKLRTMRIAAPGSDARATSANGDARITPSGLWLRRFRIDELPQLWNVMRGDMSIIGPRPEWTELARQYVEKFPVYAYRHLVRPGITGWAQVRGGYAADLEETRTKVGYDLYYIKNFSFSLDVQILFRTIWTVISGSGAR